jgi:hypothetical protein
VSRLAAGTLAVVLTLAGVGAAAPAPAAAAATCSGVWVVVDFGSQGGVRTACATSYSTGAAALRSAGFSPTLDNGMLTRIDGKPGTVDLKNAYWSYWHATPKADGSYSGWSYSNLGATAYHPVKGNAEGWHYQSLDGGNVAPGEAPPKSDPTPTPTPTKTSTKPKPKPTKSASATAKATATATRSSSATAKASATAAPSTTKATTAATPSATPSTTAPLSADEVTEAAQDQVVPPTPTQDGGSPVGAIAAGSAVLAGAVGLGGWWLMRGRRR